MIPIIENLEDQLIDIFHELQSSSYWQTFISSNTSNASRLSTMKHIMREIDHYQSEVNRSVFTSVARWGQHVHQQGMVRELLKVQIEEIGHGRMALDDYYQLGGEDTCELDLPSPPSMAVIAVVRYLGDNMHPLCHLGFMYFFERFTTMVSDLVMPFLKEAGYPWNRLDFMKSHAEEDVRHAHHLGSVINTICSNDPEAGIHIQYGFDCFREVYPHPVWKHCLEHAQKEQLCAVS